tara:strand:- start:3048 stop:3272 length:225 start_codon:yes stop_codon:yes gene_type:complete
MAITYKKLATSSPAMEEIAEGEEWTIVDVEESITQSPAKQTYTYAGVKIDLDAAKARVVELEARIAEIEAKAKS